MKIDPRIFEVPARTGPLQVRSSTIDEWVAPIRIEWPVATQLVDEDGVPFQRSFNFLSFGDSTHIDEVTFPFGEHYLRLWVKLIEESFASSTPWQRWERFKNTFWARLHFKDETIATLSWSYAPPMRVTNQGAYTHQFQGLWRVFTVDAGFALKVQVNCNAPFQCFLSPVPFDEELEVEDYENPPAPEDPEDPPVLPDWDSDPVDNLLDPDSVFTTSLTDPPEIPGTPVDTPTLMMERYLIVLVRVPSSVPSESTFTVNLTADCRGKFEFTEPVPIESIREPPVLHPQPGTPLPPGRSPRTDFPSPPNPDQLPTLDWATRSVVSPSLTHELLVPPEE